MRTRENFKEVFGVYVYMLPEERKGKGELGRQRKVEPGANWPPTAKSNAIA
jgi:hypothetical protein